MDPDLVQLAISVGGVIFFLAMGLFVGGANERRHLKNLDARESQSAGFLVTQLKSYPYGMIGPTPPTVVFGEVVISSDYLKTFLGGIRKIFGGEMHSYQTLATRARREALLRAVEQAQALGYSAIGNVRYYSSDIAKGKRGRDRAVMVTLMAVGTAYHRKPPAPQA